MAWKRLVTTDVGTGTYAISGSGDAWVLRTFTGIAGWSLGERADWTVPLPDGNVGCMDLARVGDLVAAIDHPGGGKKHASHLVVVRPDGELAWKRKLAIRPPLHGLAAIDGAFYVHGSDGKKSELQRWSAEEGKLEAKWEVRGSEVRALGATPVLSWNDGLYTVRDGAVEELVAERNCMAPLVSGDDLYFVFEDEEESWAPTIAWYDARKGAVRKSVVTPEEVESSDQCRPVAVLAEGVVAVHLGEGRGLAGIDFKKGRIAWRALAEPGTRTGSVNTGDAISYRSGAIIVVDLKAAVAGTGSLSRLVSIDAAGKERKAPPVEKAPSTVFAVGDRVAVSTATTLQVFEES
jgi:hypothetical protein